MNKIVREHYPVENLPADLRAGLGLAGTVTITIEAEDGGVPVAKDGHFTRFRHLAKPRFETVDDVNAHLAALRDG